MSKKILIVAPFSGRQVPGGLAAFNEDITKALVAEGHTVKLLTMQLPENLAPKPETHNNAEIVVIGNETSRGFTALTSKDEQRKQLYDLLNSDAVIAEGISAIKSKSFEPDIIIGHSRFSGPAAIKLKKKAFPKATVEYCLHSYPVEGSLIVGYQAYDEPIDADLASTKLADEKAWMEQADVAVGVGPLLRYGATLILGDKLGKPCRVHECIPGTTLGDIAPQPHGEPIQLLMSGRANAPIKGFEDLLLAILELRQRNHEPLKQKITNFKIKVRGWSDRSYQSPDRTVTFANVQEWANGVLHIQPPTDRSVIDIEPMTPDKQVLNGEICGSYAVLMPSYAEHFGLVPFDALGFGVPVLMSEFSGAGMFLGDKQRFGDLASDFIVHDFGDPNKKRPLQGTDFLANVPGNAFDRRPDAWAAAIEGLLQEPAKRFEAAKKIHEKLEHYTWSHCAQALVTAATSSNTNVSKQGPDGAVIPA